MTSIIHFKRAKRMAAFAFSASALAVLVACGGGGGGSTSGTSGVSLSGVASKGLVKFGIVKAYGVTSAGAIDRSRVLAQDETDINGAYELTGLPSGVTVVVEITAVKDKTKIVDEATDAELDPPSDFALSAATVLDSGTTVSDRTLQITPFSEMAVAAAVAKTGGLSSTNVASANAEIRALVGFDVLLDKPEFEDAGQTPKNATALLLAAVSEMANGKKLGCTEAAQADRVKCVVKQMSDRGADDSTLVNELNTAKNVANENEEYAGPPAPAVKVSESINLTSAQIDGVAAAKALVKSLRNNAPVISGTGADTVESRLKAIDVAASKAVDPLNDNQIKFVSSLAVVLDALARKDPLKEPSSGVLVLDEVDSACNLYPNDPSTAVENVNPERATSWATAKYAACYMFAATQSDGSYVYYDFDVMVPDVATSPYTIISRIAKYRDVDTPATAIELAGTLKTSLSDPKVIRADATLVMIQDPSDPTDKIINGITLTGELVPKVRGNGSLVDGYARMGINLVFSPSTGANPTKVNLRGELSAKNSSGLATSTVGLREGSFITANLKTAGQPYSGVANNSVSAGSFDLIAKLNTGETVSGVLAVSDFITDKGLDDVPSKLSFDGSISGTAGLIFQGKVSAAVSNLADVNTTQNESATNFYKKTLTVQGTLAAAASKPEAKVNLTLASNVTFGNYTLVGSYGSGADTINLNAVFSDNNNAADDSVTFASITGVKIVLNDVATKFNITHSGDTNVIGELDRAKNTVFYKDKTSESF